MSHARMLAILSFFKIDDLPIGCSAGNDKQLSYTECLEKEFVRDVNRLIRIFNQLPFYSCCYDAVYIQKNIHRYKTAKNVDLLPMAEGHTFTEVNHLTRFALRRAPSQMNYFFQQAILLVCEHPEIAPKLEDALYDNQFIDGDMEDSHSLKRAAFTKALILAKYQLAMRKEFYLENEIDTYLAAIHHGEKRIWNWQSKVFYPTFIQQHLLKMEEASEQSFHEIDGRNILKIATELKLALQDSSVKARERIKYYRLKKPLEYDNESVKVKREQLISTSYREYFASQDLTEQQSEQFDIFKSLISLYEMEYGVFPKIMISDSLDSQRVSIQLSYTEYQSLCRDKLFADDPLYLLPCAKTKAVIAWAEAIVAIGSISLLTDIGIQWQILQNRFWDKLWSKLADNFVDQAVKRYHALLQQKECIECKPSAAIVLARFNKYRQWQGYLPRHWYRLQQKIISDYPDLITTNLIEQYPIFLALEKIKHDLTQEQNHYIQGSGLFNHYNAADLVVASSVLKHLQHFLNKGMPNHASYFLVQRRNELLQEVDVLRYRLRLSMLYRVRDFEKQCNRGLSSNVNAETIAVNEQCFQKTPEGNTSLVGPMSHPILEKCDSPVSVASLGTEMMNRIAQYHLLLEEKWRKNYGTAISRVLIGQDSVVHKERLALRAINVDQLLKPVNEANYRCVKLLKLPTHDIICSPLFVFNTEIHRQGIDFIQEQTTGDTLMEDTPDVIDRNRYSPYICDVKTEGDSGNRRKRNQLYYETKAAIKILSVYRASLKPICELKMDYNDEIKYLDLLIHPSYLISLEACVPHRIITDLKKRIQQEKPSFAKKCGGFIVSGFLSIFGSPYQFEYQKTVKLCQLLLSDVTSAEVSCETEIRVVEIILRIVGKCFQETAHAGENPFISGYFSAKVSEQAFAEMRNFVERYGDTYQKELFNEYTRIGQFMGALFHNNQFALSRGDRRRFKEQYHHCYRYAKEHEKIALNYFYQLLEKPPINGDSYNLNQIKAQAFILEPCIERQKSWLKSIGRLCLMCNPKIHEKLLQYLLGDSDYQINMIAQKSRIDGIVDAIRVIFSDQKGIKQRSNFCLLETHYKELLSIHLPYFSKQANTFQIENIIKQLFIFSAEIYNGTEQLTYYEILIWLLDIINTIKIDFKARERLEQAVILIAVKRLKQRLQERTYCFLHEINNYYSKDKAEIFHQDDALIERCRFFKNFTETCISRSLFYPLTKAYLVEADGAISIESKLIIDYAPAEMCGELLLGLLAISIKGYEDVNKMSELIKYVRRRTQNVLIIDNMIEDCLYQHYQLCYRSTVIVNSVRENYFWKLLIQFGTEDSIEQALWLKLTILAEAEQSPEEKMCLLATVRETVSIAIFERIIQAWVEAAIVKVERGLKARQLPRALLYFLYHMLSTRLSIPFPAVIGNRIRIAYLKYLLIQGSDQEKEQFLVALEAQHEVRRQWLYEDINNKVKNILIEKILNCSDEDVGEEINDKLELNYAQALYNKVACLDEQQYLLVNGTINRAIFTNHPGQRKQRLADIIKTLWKLQKTIGARVIFSDSLAIWLHHTLHLPETKRPTLLTDIELFDLCHTIIFRIGANEKMVFSQAVAKRIVTRKDPILIMEFASRVEDLEEDQERILKMLLTVSQNIPRRSDNSHIGYYSWQVHLLAKRLNCRSIIREQFLHWLYDHFSGLLIEVTENLIALDNEKHLQKLNKFYEECQDLQEGLRRYGFGTSVIANKERFQSQQNLDTIVNTRLGHLMNDLASGLEIFFQMKYYHQLSIKMRDQCLFDQLRIYAKNYLIYLQQSTNCPVNLKEDKYPVTFQKAFCIYHSGLAYLYQLQEIEQLDQTKESIQCLLDSLASQNHLIKSYAHQFLQLLQDHVREYLLQIFMQQGGVSRDKKTKETIKRIQWFVKIMPAYFQSPLMVNGGNKKELVIMLKLMDILQGDQPGVTDLSAEQLEEIDFTSYHWKLLLQMAVKYDSHAMLIKRLVSLSDSFIQKKWAEVEESNHLVELCIQWINYPDLFMPCGSLMLAAAMRTTVLKFLNRSDVTKDFIANCQLLEQESSTGWQLTDPRLWKVICQSLSIGINDIDMVRRQLFCQAIDGRINLLKEDLKYLCNVAFELKQEGSAAKFALQHVDVGCLLKVSLLLKGFYEISQLPTIGLADAMYDCQSDSVVSFIPIAGQRITTSPENWLYQLKYTDKDTFQKFVAELKMSRELLFNYLFTTSNPVALDDVGERLSIIYHAQRTDCLVAHFIILQIYGTAEDKKLLKQRMLDLYYFYAENAATWEQCQQVGKNRTNYRYDAACRLINITDWHSTVENGDFSSQLLLYLNKYDHDHNRYSVMFFVKQCQRLVARTDIGTILVSAYRNCLCHVLQQLRRQITVLGDIVLNKNKLYKKEVIHNVLQERFITVYQALPVPAKPEFYLELKQTIIGGHLQIYEYLIQELSLSQQQGYQVSISLVKVSLNALRSLGIEIGMLEVFLKRVESLEAARKQVTQLPGDEKEYYILALIDHGLYSIAINYLHCLISEGNTLSLLFPALLKLAIIRLPFTQLKDFFNESEIMGRRSIDVNHSNGALVIATSLSLSYAYYQGASDLEIVQELVANIEKAINRYYDDALAKQNIIERRQEGERTPYDDSTIPSSANTRKLGYFKIGGMDRRQQAAISPLLHMLDQLKKLRPQAVTANNHFITLCYQALKERFILIKDKFKEKKDPAFLNCLAMVEAMLALIQQNPRLEAGSEIGFYRNPCFQTGYRYFLAPSSSREANRFIRMLEQGQQSFSTSLSKVPPDGRVLSGYACATSGFNSEPGGVMVHIASASVTPVSVATGAGSNGKKSYYTQALQRSLLWRRKEKAAVSSADIHHGKKFMNPEAVIMSSLT